MVPGAITQRAAEMFAKCFGHKPRWIVAAPGRVNLIGEHTDYNDGFVLPMAIERYTVIAASRDPAREVTLHSDTTGDSTTFSVRKRVVQGEPSWSNYVRGVIAGFQDRKVRVQGFSGAIESTLPYGGGLASSAALEVAMAKLLEVMHDLRFDSEELALLCQKAEHDFAGVPCGIMDQITSLMAQEDHALLLDCRSRKMTPVAMKDPSVTILVVNTNVRHRLAEGEYARRRAQCEEAAFLLGVPALRDVTSEQLQKARSKLSPLVFRRARHVVTENERTLGAADAIQESDWAAVGKLMYASHQSLRDDYEVSSKELDAVVEIARGIGRKGGVIGCRMTGAGFGGCAICLVRTDAVQPVTRRIQDGYERAIDTQPHIFSSRPAGGARVVQ